MEIVQTCGRSTFVANESTLANESKCESQKSESGTFGVLTTALPYD